ncbi:MAG: ABC transporter ATP-binding protein [Clostridia bacterium]|nr:ABC transporter ATP-binding protein [Clostridia bacterium]MBQ4628229.1 ABC transporter ATP-binding protein [Clostridia bacterium]
MITLKGICKTYGKGDGLVTALRPIDLEIKKGEMIAIMGKSGSGKSTLLNLLAGLDTPDSGEFIYNGSPINTKNQNKMAKFRRNDVGFVVQHFALIDEYSVQQNIGLPLRYGRLKGTSTKKRIKEIAERLEISEKLRKYPSQLSGGQAQRVAIARAIAHKPSILLADEPTGALDEETGKSIMNLFREINKEGTTVIVVTHDANVASFCQRTIRLHDGNIIGEETNVTA